MRRRTMIAPVNPHINKVILDLEAKIRFFEHQIDMNQEIVAASLNKIGSYSDEVKDVIEALLLIKGINK
jgi:hypothetical protein